MNRNSRNWGLSVAAILACAFSLCGTTAAWAGDRAHDNGFFLRLSGGIGAASTKIEDGGDEVKFDGGTGDFNFAVGAAVARNFALHGTVWGWIISNPDLTIDIGGNTFEGSVDGDLDFSAIGVGVTYYFMPVNMYLTGSAGVGALSGNGDIDGDSDLGPAFELALGKEWWVGTSWGLGVALAGGIHSVPDKDVDESWGGGNVGLRFTATLN